MELKIKPCKGTSKAIGFGCGKDSMYRKLGMCAFCFRRWLLETDEGKEYLEKNNIRSRTKFQKELKKKRADDLKQRKDDIKTFSDWMNDLQKIFNQYIRLRDADLPCISCGTIANVKYDAGHYLSVGSYPNLRVDEMNVNKQCSKNCNVEKRGNIIEYRDGLIRKYGLESVKDLEAKRQSTWKPPIYEVKEMIEHYKLKVKELKK